MILCLEESEDICLDLLSPILDSVKNDNEVRDLSFSFILFNRLL
jgi:hypothetical protein